MFTVWKRYRIIALLSLCIFILAACGGGQAASDELKAAVSAAASDDTLPSLGEADTGDFLALTSSFSEVDLPGCCGVVSSGENQSTPQNVRLEIIVEEEQTPDLALAETLLIQILQHFNPTGTDTVRINIVPMSVRPRIWRFDFEGLAWQEIEP